MSSSTVAAASWPQFRRIRGQVGPADRVLSRMHESLRSEQNLALTGAIPQPYELVLPGLRVHFDDLWHTWDGDGSSEQPRRA